MTLYFVEPSPPRFTRQPLASLAMAFNWRRPVGVAAVALLTALLHGTLLFWYLNRPPEPLVTQAMALPTIDITLGTSKAGAPAPPAPPPPKTEPKPPEKKTEPPKAKPKPPKPTPKTNSEIKKKLVKPETKPVEPEATATEEPTQAEAPAAAPAAPAADVSKASQPASQSGTVTSASADANYLNNPKPEYPRMARQRQWQGNVTLRVFVTAEGRCSELSVLRSSGHDILDEAAQDAVRQWRFVPGKRGDTPIPSWVNVPIEFALE